MAISIRLATNADIPEVAKLIPVSVRALSAGYYTEEQIESALRYVFGVDSKLIGDGTYFIAEAPGQIAGAGGWSKRSTLFGGEQSVAERADALLDPAVEPARVRAFYVHPDWARQGVATRIINACEEAARESGFKRAELMATLPGKPMYAAAGYTLDEPVDYLLPDGVTLPLARMSKEL